MTEPRVSVIIPTHNRAEMVGQSISSVQEQSFTDWECVVVDDGSTDHTEGVVQRVAGDDPRVRYLFQQGSGSPGATRNSGVTLSSGALVAFLDDDDLWLPDKLQRQVALMDAEPDVCLTFGQVQRFGAEQGIWPDLSLPPRPTLEQLLAENFVPLSTTMVRREALDQVGLFDEQMTIAEDYELWLRLARHAPMRAVPDVMCRYRVHPGGITRTNQRQLDVVEALYQRLQQLWELPPSALRPGRRWVHLRRARQAPTLVGRLGHYLRAVWP